MKMNQVTDCPNTLASKGNTISDLHLKSWITGTQSHYQAQYKSILFPDSQQYNELQAATLAYKNFSYS